MSSPLLSAADFNGVKLKAHMTPFEMLLQVAAIAAQNFEKELKEEHQNLHQPNPTNSSIKPLPKLTKGKRKLGDMSNQEWIQTMMNKKQRNEKNKNSKGIPKRGITNPTSSLPEEFQREIAKRSGVSPKTSTRMIIQKRLEKTDLNKNHGRISIPCSQVETFEFLTDEEMTCLRKEETITVRLIHKPKKKMKNGMDTPLIETPIGLRQWNLHKSMGDPEKVNPQYVLRTGWNKVVLEDGFVRGDFVQIWAFRDAQDNLSMALVKVDEQEDAETLT